MPLSVKIQPISARDATEPPTRTPVVRSRLKRLFRISVADKPVIAGSDETLFAPPAADQAVEPSSVCLAKMVQNFIEESSEKPPASGRNRCNCFNGNGSDDSDAEPDSVDTSDFLKGLVTCANVRERNILADTAKIVEKTGKGGKRKDELRRSVADELAALGYDASLCASKWEKSPSFPAGEYEYVDVITSEAGERLIVDVDFRSEFEIARSTKAYKQILQILPNIFVGKPDRLARIVTLVSEAARISLKKKGLHFPPWRKAEYVQAKWLSSHTRLRSGSGPADPTSIGSFDSIDILPVTKKSDENGENDQDLSNNSMDDQPIFVMSDSSGEEDVKISKKKTTP
ncbi:hypothetical protein V2J09_020089 [Rumex salicifolius]